MNKVVYMVSFLFNYYVCLETHYIYVKSHSGMTALQEINVFMSSIFATTNTDSFIYKYLYRGICP